MIRMPQDPEGSGFDEIAKENDKSMRRTMRTLQILLNQIMKVKTPFSNHSSSPPTQTPIDAYSNVRKTINKKKKTTKKTQKKKKKRSRVVFVDQEEEEEMEQDENATIPSLMTLYSEIVCTEKPDVEESVRRWMRRYEKRAMEEENGMVSDDMISSPTHELLAFVLLVTAGDVPKSLPRKVISLFETI